MEYGGEAIMSIPLPSDLGLVSIGLFLGAAGAAEGVALADRLKDKNLYYMQWKYNGETYYYIADSEPWLDTNDRNTINGTLYKLGEVQTTEVYEKTSTAYTLRPTIARWYIALRNFSLVALLSILLYIGIRIILSSTAQDKSKYKKMLIDWLTAVAMLFVLHYLMVLIMTITQKLTGIFNVTNIAADGTDIFVTNIRNMVTGNNNDSYFKYFGYVIMYVAITILTLVFTIQYLKRLVFIAFLTLISPLIALTYPLDKIKDGQAQAFSMWIKEYIFNCLLQPAHLLLYTIFIGSATGLVDTNPVYAIVVLAFFTPAEKFFRRMFGFEKASSIGPLGAATGGALLMSMLNKLQGKATSHNNSSNNEASNNKVRTVDNGAGYDNGQETSENSENDAGSESSIVPGRRNGRTSGAGRTGLGISGGSASGNSGVGGRTNSARKNSGIRGGLRAVRRSIIGPSTLKSAGRWIGNKAIKAGGAFAGATIGLAAGVASGDLKSVARNTTAGAIAGGNITSGIGKKIQNKAGNLYKTFKEGMQGKEGTTSEDIHTIEQESREEETREDYINNGITGENEISTAMENGISSREYRAYEEAGIEDIEDMVAISKAGISGSEYKAYEEAGITDLNTMASLNQAGISANELKSRKRGTVEAKKVENARKEKETQETVENINPDLGRVRYAEKYGIPTDEYKAYKKAGVPDASAMSSLRNSGITDDEYKAYKKVGISDAKEIERLRQVDLAPEDLIKLRELGQTDISKIIDIKKKHEDYSKEHFVNMFKLAKKSPKTLQEFKEKMKSNKADGDSITEVAIEEIFKELKDFF